MRRMSQALRHFGDLINQQSVKRGAQCLRQEEIEQVCSMQGRQEEIEQVCSVLGCQEEMIEQVCSVHGRNSKCYKKGGNTHFVYSTV